MTDSYSKRTAIIIEPDWEKVKYIKKILGRLGMKKIAIINIRCLNNRFLEIKNLLSDCAYPKIFHGGSEINFSDMIMSFSLGNRKDVMYVGGRLESRKLSDCYQKYIFKPFPPTFSSNISSKFEEI